MKTLLIRNDPAFGTERSYGASPVRSPSGKAGSGLLPVGDAVTCVVAAQKVPDGYHHVKRMILGSPPRWGRGLLRHLHGRPWRHRQPPDQGHPALDPGRARGLDGLGGQGIVF